MKKRNRNKLIAIDRNFIKEYEEKIKNDPYYTIEVDPKNYYNLSDQQKDFIKYYIEYKDIKTAAKLSFMSMETAMVVFNTYGAQEEIRRISRALYQRQFAQKMITLDEMGGWLTSLLIDDVPIGDRINIKTKLLVARTILDIKQMQMNTINNPTVVAEIDLENEIKNLSVESIKKLIESSDEIKKKTELINKKFNKEGGKSEEELKLLNSLSYKELLELLEKNKQIKKGGK